MGDLSDAQRSHILELISRGQELPVEYRHLLFPPERKECELVYAGKAREEDILAETMAMPLQPIRTFGPTDTGWSNMLVFGDNLQVMKTLLGMKKRGHLRNSDGTPGPRLVYIDPPFATKQEFHGNERAYSDKVAGAQFVEFLRKRLVFFRQLLADDGSIVVHLDTRKSHYLKVIMDEVFGEQNFKAELIWYYRKYQMRGMRGFANNSERLLWYVKSSEAAYTYNPLTVPLDTPKYLKRKHWDKELRRIVNVRDDEGNLIYDEYTDEKVDDVWDIPFMGATSPERTGYPTQKPEALLDRVIGSLSSPGDLILDAFAGSGTTLSVAEKLGRRWIGIDSSKLAIYTIQKRMLNLRESIGNRKKSSHLPHSTFTLYNGGLYDFSKLKALPWDAWRLFALNLFQCTDEPHMVRGIELDGYRGADDVMVFNHTLSGGAVLDYGFIDEIHAHIASRISSDFFIIAPAASVAFLEDYVDKGNNRYYVLRIPYSIVDELHSREFEAIKQPLDEAQVNATVEALGFDFIRSPKIECGYLLDDDGNPVIHIRHFRSEALAKEARLRDDMETLSMVLVDYDYPYDPTRKGKESPPPFQLDAVFYAADIAKTGWKLVLPRKRLGRFIMLVYVDIYGNEHTEVKAATEFSREVD